MRELRVREMEHKKVAADVFDEITLSTNPMSLFSA